MRISENIAPHEVIKSIAELIRDFAGNPTVRKIIDGAGSLIYDYLPSGAIVILIASLLVCLCGRKLLPLLKVLLFFGVGYVASAALITPPNAESFGVIMHVTLGAVAAALSRPLYFVTYVTASGGAAFLWVYSGALISSAADNAYIALLAALIAITFRAWSGHLTWRGRTARRPMRFWSSWASTTWGAALTPRSLPPITGGRWRSFGRSIPIRCSSA